VIKNSRQQAVNSRQGKISPAHPADGCPERSALLLCKTRVAFFIDPPGKPSVTNNSTLQ